MAYQGIKIAAALLLGTLVTVGQAQSAECLRSARAVWVSHPGSWAVWNHIDGRKCWRVGVRREEAAPVAQPKVDERPWSLLDGIVALLHIAPAEEPKEVMPPEPGLRLHSTPRRHATRPRLASRPAGAGIMSYAPLITTTRRRQTFDELFPYFGPHIDELRR